MKDVTRREEMFNQSVVVVRNASGNPAREELRTVSDVSRTLAKMAEESGGRSFDS